MVVLAAATVIEGGTADPITDGTLEKLGVVATTAFVIAGLAAAYRAVTTRTWTIVPIVVMLLGPGALWCWLMLVRGQATGPLTATTIVLVASTVGVVLLIEGIGHARWLGVFCGLGAVGISVAAAMVRVSPRLQETASLTLLVAFAGMACLYGTLVEVESSGRRTVEQLVKAKRRIEGDIAEAEEVLHDLRSGLLSIEAALAGLDDPIGDPIRAEMARLRLLAARSHHRVENVDVVPGIRSAAAARRFGGLEIELNLPETAPVRADQSDVLAVVDNMLANAQRHGASPIRVEVGRHRSTVRITVIDAGRMRADCEPDGLFQRGFSTHTDGDGIGLGRARDLAERNGGTLRYVPGPGGETQFVLSLPVAVETTIDVSAPTADRDHTANHTGDRPAGHSAAPVSSARRTRLVRTSS